MGHWYSNLGETAKQALLATLVNKVTGDSFLSAPGRESVGAFFASYHANLTKHLQPTPIYTIWVKSGEFLPFSMPRGGKKQLSILPVMV